MWLELSSELVFDIATPTPFTLMLRPRSGELQTVVREEYRLTPNVPMTEFTDGYGNLCQRLVAIPGKFIVATSATVMAADDLDQTPGAPFIEVAKLPDALLSYLLPSRYCESDRFGQMAVEITGGEVPGYDQVGAILAWLQANIRYVPGCSEAPTSAIEVNQNQFGVCRDLAHLGIALCRSICIPARFVAGYLYRLEPMELHAWFEAYVGGRWFTFDATQTELRGGYVAIGYGRDAADVAIYNQFGPAVFPLKQETRVRLIDGMPE